MLDSSFIHLRTTILTVTFLILCRSILVLCATLTSHEVLRNGSGDECSDFKGCTECEGTVNQNSGVKRSDHSHFDPSYQTTDTGVTVVIPILETSYFLDLIILSCPPLSHHSGESSSFSTTQLAAASDDAAASDEGDPADGRRPRGVDHSSVRLGIRAPGPCSLST